MPIHGRVTALPNTNHEKAKLSSVAAIAARLNMSLRASCCTSRGAVISVGAQW